MAIAVLLLATGGLQSVFHSRIALEFGVLGENHRPNRSLANFLNAPLGFKLGDDEGQRALIGHTLDHLATRAGPALFDPFMPVAVKTA